MVVTQACLHQGAEVGGEVPELRAFLIQSLVSKLKVTFLSCRLAPSLLTCTSLFTKVFWPEQRERTGGVNRWSGAASPTRAGSLGSTPPATPGMLAQCRELWSRDLAHGLFSPSVWLTR